jgi:hypothetical protein
VPCVYVAGTLAGHPTVMDEGEVRPIFGAVSGGDVNELARLMDANPHLMEARNPDSYRQTPLMMAAKRGHVGVVRLLVERGADVNAAGPFGSTALHFAAEGGHGEMVSILLNHGADPSRRDHLAGTTPLCSASGRGHLGVVRQLLQVPECGLVQKEMALWETCLHGHVEILRALLLAGAGHSISVDTAWALRDTAEEKGHTECVALLEVSGRVYYHRRHQLSHFAPCIHGSGGRGSWSVVMWCIGPGALPSSIPLSSLRSRQHLLLPSPQASPPSQAQPF